MSEHTTSKLKLIPLAALALMMALPSAPASARDFIRVVRTHEPSPEMQLARWDDRDRDMHARIYDGPRGDHDRGYHRHIDGWEDGHWQRGRHNNHIGWWWVVGGNWYFYDMRVAGAAYPDPDRVIVVYTPQNTTTSRYGGYSSYAAQERSDQRVLNGFAMELSDVGYRMPGERGQLRDLAARVAEFRSDLMGRDYNAMQLLRDTEALQDRISARLRYARR